MEHSSFDSCSLLFIKACEYRGEDISELERTKTELIEFDANDLCAYSTKLQSRSRGNAHCAEKRPI